MKRLLDALVSLLGLLVAGPFLLLVAAAIFLYDFRNPLYLPNRVGKGGRIFRMVKLRSMVVGADKTGVNSTSSEDSRITGIGRFVRRFKLDELMQLWNVLIGDMSLVGPRPNVPAGVAVYTSVERRLLDVRPGITDFGSLVFADEGEILRGHPDADLAYDQLIRPWKSRLGLFYLDKQSLSLDIRLVCLTILSLMARRTALAGAHNLLLRAGAPRDLANVALRREPLRPKLPPGSESEVAAV